LIIDAGITDADRALSDVFMMPWETNNYVSWGTVTPVNSTTVSYTGTDLTTKLEASYDAALYMAILDDTGEFLETRKVVSYDQNIVTVAEAWTSVPAGAHYIMMYLSPTIFANEDEQTDTLKVYNDRSSDNDSGTLTNNQLTGLGMGVNGITYKNLENVQIWLGTGNDTFTVTSIAVNAVTDIWGGPGSDTFNIESNAMVANTELNIFGDTGNDVFNINSNATANDSEMNISGGDDNDTFNIMKESAVAGALITFDGNAGNDIWYFYESWGQIDQLLDSGGGNDTLDFTNVGADEKLRFIISADRVTVTIGDVTDLSQANSVTHLGNTIDNLIGGPDNDSFRFNDGAVLASGDAGSTQATIDGYLGNANLLDYARYTSGIVVDLSNNKATGLTYVTNVQNVTGGSGNDSITGDDQNNVLNGGPGDDILTGLGGNDYYMFQDGWGNDTINEDADGGEDIISFYASVGDTITWSIEPVTADLVFRLDNDGLWDTVADQTNGTNSLKFTSLQIEYAFSGVGRDSLYTLNTDSIFNLDGVNNDTDPLFTPDIYPTMVAAADRNTYIAIAKGYDLEFANFERIYAGNCSDDFTLSGRNQSYELYGGAGNDLFRFADGITMFDRYYEASIDGQGGEDTIWLDYTTPVQVDLSTGMTSVIAANAVNRLSNMENIVGGSADDTLTGDAGNNIICGREGNDILTGGLGDDIYLFGNGWGNDIIYELANGGRDMISMAGYLPLGIDTVIAVTSDDVVFTIGTGGITVSSGANTILYNGNDLEDLTGGSGNDSFVLTDNAILTGRIDGYTGNDTLNFNDYTTQRDVILTELGGLDGFAGQEKAVAEGFTNINRIIAGGSGTDSFTGMNADATFTINELNNTYLVGVNELTFSNFEYVSGGSANDIFNITAANQQIKEYMGGAGDDTFNIIGDATVPGLINGQGGKNRLNYSDYNHGVLVDLASHLAQAIFGGAAGGIFGIDWVTGSKYADTLIGDEYDNTLEGLDGDDILIGAAGNDLLMGGWGSDIYKFLLDWGSDIVDDLGGLADVIDFSDVSVAMTFTFMFSGVGVVGGGQRLEIRANNIERIKSGSGDDRFVFGEDGVQLAGGSGYIDGGGGANTLDYQAYGALHAVDVDLAGGTATGTNAVLGIVNISNVYGGAGNDILKGNDNDNILRGGLGDDIIDGRGGVDTLDEGNATADLNIDLSRSDAQITGIGNDTISNIENLITGSGNDVLTGTGNGSSCLLAGGEGNDRYVFTGDWRNYRITDSGGINDVFDFSAINSSLIFVFDCTVSINMGDYTFDHNDGGIEQFLGGSGNDTFFIKDGMAAGITIDGQGGIDTIDFGSCTTGSEVELLTIVSIDGFNGTKAASSLVFNNIDILQGSNNEEANDTLIGADLAAVWKFVDSNYTYSAGGAQLIFYGFENLQGGSDVDTMDYSEYGSGITINLQNSTISGIAGTYGGMEQLIGSPGTDQIIARESGSTFAITSAGSGVADGWLTFAGIEDICGGSGVDKLDFRAVENAIELAIAGITAQSGFSGNESVCGIRFSGINEIIGSGASDRAIGTSAAAVWSVIGSGTSQYHADGETLTLTSIEHIVGSSSGDVLSYEDYTVGGVLVAISGAGTESGFKGSATGLLSFDNMNTVIGSAQDDTLAGANLNAEWLFSSDQFTYKADGRELIFSSIELLKGGNADDLFRFTDGAVFTENIDGGLGNDTLDYSAYTTGIAVTLTAVGTLDGMAGSAAGQNGTAVGLTGSFTNINVLLGGLGSDKLNGANLNAIFEIDGSNRYLAGGLELAFSSFEQLAGGSADDTFRFGDGSVFTGTIAGGAGLDWLDFSANTSSITGSLTSFSDTGYSGSIAAISDGFAGIDGIIGSARTGVNGDRLNGIANLAGSWVLNGTSSSYTADGAAQGLSFLDFELLYGGLQDDLFIITGNESARIYGGPGHDTFRLMDGASLAGSIDVGGGINTLDYGTWTTPVTIDLASYTATNISLGIAAIQNICGGQADDILIGDNGDNILAGGGGNDRLIGGLGDDTYLFEDDFGTDTVIDVDGSDTLDFSAVTANLHFITGSYLITSGANQVVYASATEGFTSLIEKFIGGSGDDVFSFDPNNELRSGTTINGGAGSDTLDYSAYTTDVSVNLALGTATGKFAYTQFENVTGGSGKDVLVGDDNDNILIGGAGDDKLTGGGGNDLLNGGDGKDTYIFNDNWGSDSLIDASGIDIADFSAVQHDLTFTINVDSLAVTGGANLLSSPANMLEQLLGGLGNDKFVFADGATFTSGEGDTLIDGGKGSNTLDYSAYTSAVEVDLSKSLATGVNKISNIKNITGGFGNDVLTGDSSDNILAGGPGDDILNGGSGNDRYVFAADWGNDTITENNGGGNDTLDFGNITVPMLFTIGKDSINITDGSSTFTYTGSNIETFAGGSDNDTFKFLDGAKTSGSIDGQGGYDTLDLSAYTSACQITLNSLGTINGFSGVTSLLGTNGFNNINNVIGSAAAGVSDTLTGWNAPATFYLAEGRYQSGTNTLDYSGFENLKGGSDADTFVFADGSVFNGSISGGAGKDTLDYSSWTSAVTINLETRQTTGLTGNFSEMEAINGGSGSDTLIGPDKGAVFNVSSSAAGTVIGTGNTGNFEFQSVEYIQAGAGADTLTMENHDGPVTLDLQNNIVTGLIAFSGIESFTGSSSTADKIIGLDTGSSFKLTGDNSGTVDGKNFKAFENLTGGSGNDSFAFSGNATLSGSIDGGAGSNTLDYSSYNSAVTFNLLTSSSTGLNGFSNINTLVGSKSIDTIISTDADTIFTITGNNSGSVGDILFSAIENLQGGSGNDKFIFSGSGKISGTVDGKGGTNTLDYSGYGEAVTLNLQTLTATGLAKFASVQIYIGSSNNDTLIGSDQGSAFRITGTDSGIVNDTFSFASVETLQGGSGNDTFIFVDTAGLSGDIKGGGGIDTLDYSGYSSAVVINLTTGKASNVVKSISQLENLIGSAYDDSLTGDGQANTINGMAGDDELIGGGGNDVYIFTADWGNDTVVEIANGGTDKFDFSNVTTDLTFALGSDYIISDGVNTVIHSGGQIEQLQGGSGNDKFNLIGSSTVKGWINGGAGSNTLDFSEYSSGRSIILTALGSVDGFAGTETSVTAFDNIQSIIGSNTNADTLTGLNANSVYKVTGSAAGSYESGERSLSFQSIERLNGGSGADQLDFSGVAAAIAIIITSANNSGFAGSENNLPEGFAGMDQILGTALNDSFTGLNQTASFEISDAVVYRYNNLLLNLDGFEVLKGGSAADTFTLTGSSSFNGSIDGQGGKDVLNYASYQSAATVRLTGIGAIDGFTGTATGLAGSFTNIDHYVGSDASGDVLTGLDEDTVWNLQGFKLYASGGHNLDLTGVEILRGGNGDDTFIIKGATTFLLDGGGGNNTLDYSQYTQAITVDLQNSNATGLNSFSNIQSLVGSAYVDTLIGTDAGSIFNVTGEDEGNVDGSFAFSGVEKLVGGSGNDSFAFSGSGSISATVIGGAGNDTIDYSTYGSAVNVDLSTGTSTGINADAEDGISGIENIVGSAFDDSLTGDDNDNIIDGGRGNDTLTGGAGNDIYIIRDNWGSDTVTDAADGDDSLDFSAVTAALIIDLAEAKVSSGENLVNYSGIENITAGSGNDKFYITGSQSMNLYGGNGDDCFIFSNNGSLIGTIDGGNGQDILDYSAYASGRSIVLTKVGSLNGFDGEETDTISAGFVNMDGIAGGQSLDTFQGLNADAEFNIYTDRVEYSSEGQSMIITGLENLVGGDKDDQFIFHDQAKLPGDHNSIDGRGGKNTLDFSGYASGRTISLNGLGSLNGFAGTDSSLLQSVLAFDNIQALIGSNAAGDTLNGLDTDSVYKITGSGVGSYENGERSLYFAGIEKLAGGSGKDTLDFSGMDSSRHIIISGIGANGFAGSEDAISGGFTGMDVLAGSAATDIFTGLNQAAEFDITTNTVIYRYNGMSLQVDGFEVLQGGSAADKFIYRDGAHFDGTLDGQGGQDTLDYSDYNQAVTSVLTGLGTIDGFSGITDGRGNFTNIDSIVGSSASDDVLTSQDVDTVWDLGDFRIYSATGIELLLTGVEIIQAGSGDDRFIIRGPTSFIIDGGGGNNTLDYSQYIEGIIVNLQNFSATGLISFSNIQALVGSAHADTIIGSDTGAIFSITGTDTGLVDGEFAFAGVENLVAAAVTTALPSVAAV
jgi:Ca2+-binding RTX toxin-like protein